MDLSATVTRSSGFVPSAGHVACPMLTPTLVLFVLAIAASNTDCSIASFMRAAVLRSAPGMSTQNSSPPSLTQWSSGRADAVRIEAIFFNTSSPALWPKVSLHLLKSLTSIISNENGGSICCKTVSNLRLFRSPVRGSVSVMRSSGCMSDLRKKSRSSLKRGGATFPEIFKASAEFAAPQSDDVVGTRHGPVHAGPFEACTDDHFASRLQYTRGSA